MGGSGGGGSRTFGRPSEPSPPPTPSGGAGGGGGGGGGGQPDLCEDIDVIAILQSPQAGVVAGLRKGDQLVLQITAGGAPVIAVNQAGQTAGSIVIRDMAALINCIKSGRRFVAEVLQIAGGAVTIRVHLEMP